MRKLRICLRALLAGVFLWAAGMLPAGAADIWVDHWNREDADIYLMDDTISCFYESRSHIRRINVSAKMVRNGQLLKVIHWEFMKYKTDMWRYRTDTMDRKITSVVIPHNRIFEYCMDQIGWSYYIRSDRGRWYY